MIKKVFPFTIFGIASGALSLFVFILSLNESLPGTNLLSYGPGFIFGITISVLLYFKFRKSIYFHIIFIIGSIFAYYIATHTFFYLNNENNSTTALLAAGLIGSLVLTIILRCVYFIPIKYLLAIVVVGTLAGIPDPDKFMIFPLWQATVSTVIGFAMNKSILNSHKTQSKSISAIA